MSPISALSRRTLLASALAGLSSAPARATSQSGAQDGQGEIVLRIGDQRGATRSLLRAAGVLNDLPYRIEWSFFPVGAPLITALAAGALDFGYIGDATAIFAIADNRPIRIITAWRVDGAANALLVPHDSSARNIRDLIGRRISYVKGSPGHLLVLAALAREGLTPQQIVSVPLSAANARTALAGGDIDAWAIWDPYAATVEIQDHARRLLTSRGLVDEVECGVAGEAAIATKHAQLLDFIERVNHACSWGLTHVDERAQSFSEDTGVPLDVAKLSTSRMNFTPLARITDEAIAIHQHVADMYLSAGVIASHVDIAKFYDRSFSLAT